jgi:hypothetical protein
METKYYEYVGTQKNADEYDNPKPILGNIYPSFAKIGVKAVTFWAAGSDSISNEWQLVEKELSTEDLIELLNKQAAKDGMTCSVTFDKKPGIEITRFEVKQEGFLPNSQVSFIVFLGAMEIICKESKIIEAIKNVLEND